MRYLLIVYELDCDKTVTDPFSPCRLDIAEFHGNLSVASLYFKQILSSVPIQDFTQTHLFSTLAHLVEEGENVKAVCEADRLLTLGVSVRDIVNYGLTPALQALKQKCSVESFQLLDVLLASRAMVEVIDQSLASQLSAKLDKVVQNAAPINQQSPAKTLVIGTIAGDVHDLGKHLVATLSRLSNIQVIDLGKDVPPADFAAAAARHQADIIGVSSLMTVCLPTINEIRPLVKEYQINPTIIAGGAAIQQAEQGFLDVDYQPRDAFEGIDLILEHASIPPPHSA